MCTQTLARGFVIQQAIGEQLEALGCVALGAGSEDELVQVHSQAEGGVLDATRCAHNPSLFTKTKQRICVALKGAILRGKCS